MSEHHFHLSRTSVRDKEDYMTVSIDLKTPTGYQHIRLKISLLNFTKALTQERITLTDANVINRLTTGEPDNE